MPSNTLHVLPVALCCIPTRTNAWPSDDWTNAMYWLGLPPFAYQTNCKFSPFTMETTRGSTGSEGVNFDRLI
jgi:hypothetical protein